MKSKICTILLLIFTSNIQAADINVPADYPTIQEAIAEANAGDVVIVANGTYFENINFLGKEILVTSMFHITGDENDIALTIINGSQPSDTDFGSCVTFSDGEGPNSILKGFTITQGSGTKTYNAAEDLFFRTGGGILIDNSSPTVTNNIIKQNVCTADDGVFGAGGGGIRMGFGVPSIINNVITENTGGYAGGIMIAYCGGAVLKNNLISYNTGTGSFNGGGGVFVDWEPVTLENNTIVNNHSGDKGGGVISTGTTTVIINSIIYGNTAVNGDEQIFKRFGGGNANVTYSAIEGGFNGVGNEEGVITDEPLFIDSSSFIFTDASPCIDTGNSDSQYNDIEDPSNTGMALYPAKGTLINDMGVYGGQGAESVLATQSFNEIKGIEFSYKNPYTNEGITVNSNRNTKISIEVYTIDGKRISEQEHFMVTQGVTILPLSLTTNSLVYITEANKNTKTLKILKL